MGNRRKKGERNGFWGLGDAAKAVMDPQNHPFSTYLVLLPRFGSPLLLWAPTLAHGEMFWNQKFSLTVNRIRVRTPDTQKRHV